MEDLGSTAFRQVGFDGDNTACLIYAGVLVCAVVGRLRPATLADALAVQLCRALDALGHPNDNDNDNDTLREVPHLSMRAWPYRQERRGHGPTKKNLSYR